MRYKEIKKNIFDIPDKYFLCHCISVDCKMGAGIAVDFKKKFSQVSSLKPGVHKVGTAVLTGRVFNLFTKKVYGGKPTEMTMLLAVQSMKDQCVAHGIKSLAMPKIGCGLDQMSWGLVRQIVTDVFEDTDIDIIVCSL